MIDHERLAVGDSDERTEEAVAEIQSEQIIAHGKRLLVLRRVEYKAELPTVEASG
jgi:hypothetical protein